MMIWSLILIHTFSVVAKKVVLDDTLETIDVDYYKPESIQDIMYKTTVDNKIVRGKTVAVGSRGVTANMPDLPKGLFATMYTAYLHHWDLITSPEDWWFTITQRIALAINNNADNENVRNYFVKHKGKKRLEVKTGSSIYGTDYSWFFDQMTNLVAENINDPKYVSNMRPDFTTTSDIHLISTNIAIMSSLQEYFVFVSHNLCGIPKIEMKGTLGDWQRLRIKFLKLKEQLEPINEYLNFHSDAYKELGRNNTWWETAENVLIKLEDTYKGLPDRDWWKNVILDQSFGGCGTPIWIFNGWFIRDFLGMEDDSEMHSGVTAAPLTIKGDGEEEEGAVVAGILGFDIKKGLPGGSISIESRYAWALMLDPESKFRSDLDNFDANVVDTD